MIEEQIEKVIGMVKEAGQLRLKQLGLIRELVEIAYANLPGARHDLYECQNKYMTPGSDWFDGEHHEPCQTCRCRGALKGLLDVLPERARTDA